MFDVIALGELLIDFAPVSKDPEGYPTLAAHPGGAPGNFLAALSQYGASTAMIGKVGDDMFGHRLLGTLEERGIDVSGVMVDKDVFTTLAFVSLDETGNRDFSFARKPGADTCLKASEIPERLFEGSRVFHFGTLSLTHEPARSATEEAIRLARKHGLWISLDPNLRKPLWPGENAAREAMEWSFHHADIVKVSDEEIEFLWGLKPEEGADRLLQMGVSLVYVTMGSKGALASTGTQRVQVSSPSGIHPIDTTGAGDIFGGSAMSQLLATKKAIDQLHADDLTSITCFACTAASLSTEKHGGISSVPGKEMVLERMRKSLQMTDTEGFLAV